MAEEKLILASANVAAGAEGDAPGDDEAADPVSAAVVRSLDAKLESIDDLIARLEIEEGEVRDTLKQDQFLNFGTLCNYFGSTPQAFDYRRRP